MGFIRWPVITETLPAVPPRWPESPQGKTIRINQGKIWRRYAAGLPAVKQQADVFSTNIDSASSYLMGDEEEEEEEKEDDES